MMRTGNAFIASGLYFGVDSIKALVG